MPFPVSPMPFLMPPLVNILLQSKLYEQRIIIVGNVANAVGKIMRVSF